MVLRRRHPSARRKSRAEKITWTARRKAGAGKISWRGRRSLRAALLGALLVAVCLCALASRREATAQSRAQASPSIRYAGAWGVKGDGPGQLDHPSSIATDPAGSVYIADSGSGFIHKFDPVGTPLLSFQDVSLRDPAFITVDDGGAMYVADSDRHSVLIFFPNGDRYRELRWGIYRAAEDALSVAVGDDGTVEVLDAGADKVFVYTSRLRLLRSWRPLGPGGALAGAAPSRSETIAAGPNGDFYVADPPGNRILRFTPEGQLVSEIDARAQGTGRNLSGEFAVSKNALFVMDADGHTLHVWDLTGSLTEAAAPKLDFDLAPQLGWNNRVSPPLAVSPRGELLVLDAPQSRVLRYRINF